MKIPDVQLIGTTPGMKVISMAHWQNIVGLYIIRNGNLFYDIKTVYGHMQCKSAILENSWFYLIRSKLF